MGTAWVAKRGHSAHHQARGGAAAVTKVGAMQRATCSLPAEKDVVLVRPLIRSRTSRPL